MSSLQPLHYSGYAPTGAARISLPVAPANYIYSHFEHVSGVSAPEGTRGVSITKLKILDALIDQLTRLKDREGPAVGYPRDEQIDSLINTYKRELKTAQAAHAAMPYNPQPSGQTGVLFNLSA